MYRLLLTHGSPIRAISGAAVLTLGLVGYVAVLNWQSNRMIQNRLVIDLRARELARQVEMAPDVTDTIMGVVREGELNLIPQYEVQARALTQTLDRIRSIGGGNELEFVARELYKANESLMSIEMRALEARRDGREAEATELVGAQSYRDALDQFDSMSAELTRLTESQVQLTLRDIDRLSRRIYLSIGLIIPTLALSWTLTLVALRRHLREEERLVARLEEMSIRDALTGLLNRNGFLLLADQQWKQMARRGEKMCLLYADLDGLKAINDNHGHEAGDAAIRATADVLRECFRASDLMARVGGDEFVVMGPAGSERDLMDMLRRIEQRGAGRNAEEGAAPRLSISAGGVVVDPSTTSLDVAMAQADTAMYAEKRARRRSSTLNEQPRPSRVVELDPPQSSV